MSTRSCIARKTSSTAFLGVYHHWDGYPDGLGQTLFSLYNGHFQHDLGKMLAFLIDEHPGGWSSIQGADWTLAAGFRREDDMGLCATCGLEQWKHYSQYYKNHGMADFVANLKDGIYQMFNHTFKEIEAPKGPECFCHGSRNETDGAVDEQSDSGMEWAYVFDEPNRIMYVFERLYNADAGPGRELFSGKPIEDLSFAHMTGMFGAGADGNQHWAIAAKINLDGPEPFWGDVSAARYLMAAA